MQFTLIITLPIVNSKKMWTSHHKKKQNLPFTHPLIKVEDTKTIRDIILHLTYSLITNNLCINSNTLLDSLSFTRHRLKGIQPVVLLILHQDSTFKYHSSCQSYKTQYGILLHSTYLDLILYTSIRNQVQIPSFVALDPKNSTLENLFSKSTNIQYAWSKSQKHCFLVHVSRNLIFTVPTWEVQIENQHSHCHCPFPLLS